MGLFGGTGRGTGEGGLAACLSPLVAASARACARARVECRCSSLTQAHVEAGGRGLAVQGCCGWLFCLIPRISNRKQPLRFPRFCNEAAI